MGVPRLKTAGRGGLLLLLVATNGQAACLNRSVRITLGKRHVKELEAKFAVLSHLPYTVTAVASRGEDAVVDLSYRRLTPGDQYHEPLSPELGARVFDILKPDLKALEVRKIEVAYDPAEKC